MCFNEHDSQINLCKKSELQKIIISYFIGLDNCKGKKKLTHKYSFISKTDSEDPSSGSPAYYHWINRPSSPPPVL